MLLKRLMALRRIASPLALPIAWLKGVTLPAVARKGGAR